MSWLIILLSSCWAYFSTLNTGQMLREDEYRISIEPQFVSSTGGVNLVGHFDTFITSDKEFRLTLGTGSQTDFQTGALLKWVPFPDFENQPAIGIMVGGLFGRFDRETQTSVRLVPFVSKNYIHETGDYDSYISLPTGITTVKSSSYNPLQMAFGVNYKSPELKYITWGTEIGLNLSQAFNYVSLFGTLTFDETRGILFE